MDIFKKPTPKEDKSDLPKFEEKAIDISAEAIHSEKAEELIDDKDIAEEEDFDNPEVLDHQLQNPENTPIDLESKKTLIFLELSHLVRKLNDAESQIKQRKIYWKSETNMTGIMTLNEVITIACNLKHDIKVIGDELIDKFKVEDVLLNEKIKEFSGDLKTYDFWVK